ncbi:metal-dependent hydrolase [Alteromonas ponticola]|uniref:Metal-dependent hydrolase n=1 Tax=Alteromonas aquimaris TaxID=2998417 RepID=A0ABT3PAK2_9ALTE|nr:metal-dependent hydrolase [Alteromonas aquimaris]MCW8109730.1 metal-dependent hydrolase [Alteromonas aquimaris]
MDPVTQGALGATAALLFCKQSSKLKRAAFIGCAGGMAPDLDIFFQSSQDPLLALELHRQFTHALIFIPFGGFVVALCLWGLFFRQVAFKSIYWCATAGYATHALLDSCTSYGTQLLWPFSDLRIAWDIVGIIDFFITLPLLSGIFLTIWLKRKGYIYLAIGSLVAYLCLGALQHQRAVNETIAIARQQGHTPVHIKAMPTIGNVIVWRTLYEADHYYYVNAVAVPIIGNPRIYTGPRVKRLQMERDFPKIPLHSVQFNDVARFRWFADDWLVIDPHDPDRIVDLRYSAKVEGIKPLWGIQLNAATPDQHVQYVESFPTRNRKIIPLDKIFD